MRDPLSQVRIRYKLPLGFLAICLVAFGIGGVVLTSEARSALEEQIQRRLDERAAALRVVVQRHLELHARRTEDFASDGFIRRQFEQLADMPTDSSDSIRGALTRHLRENKLPIVDAFVGAVLYAPSGRAELYVPDTARPAGDLAPLDATAIGPMDAAREAGAPTFRVRTPLRSLAGDRRIGTLELVVSTDTWMKGMAELDTLPPMQLEAMELRGEGAVLDLQTAGVAPQASAPSDALITFKRPVAGTGWELILSVDRAQAMTPADRLRNQYILIGLALLLVTAGVMFFPVRFLLKPLSNISETARRLGAGDFQARVDHESGDEIGDLARAFNFMADAVEDRTQQLERAAGAIRKREQETRLEHDRLEAVIRSMEDGLFILDAEGTVTLSNAAARPIVESLAGAPDGARRLECGHQDNEELACLMCLANLEQEQQSCILERDGRIFEVYASLLPSAPGATPSRLCVSRDVTNRLQAQESQAHQERMTVLGEIAAVMAHELNNPLAAISMFSQILLKEMEPGSTLYESADVIQRNVKTCKHTISGLLDLAARGTIATTRVDVGELIADVMRLLRPITQRAGVDVALESQVEDTVLVADQVQLRQVFTNLLMNAVQASASGDRVRVTTSGDDAMLHIEIADTGGGIPASVQARVFEPFFTTKGAGVGTGLGLPTSRRIVEEHGGRLELTTSSEEGTVFTVALPRKAERAEWRTEARLGATVGGAGVEGPERGEAE